jgi:hypothetical protein
MEHMNKITIPVAKPRNPLVALTRSRKAGSHAQNRRQGRRDERRLQD